MASLQLLLAWLAEMFSELLVERAVRPLGFGRSLLALGSRAIRNEKRGRHVACPVVS